MSLDFTRCDLTGTLPTELGVLQSMAVLGLGRNDLTGTIPSEIGMLSNLGTGRTMGFCVYGFMIR